MRDLEVMLLKTAWASDALSRFGAGVLEYAKHDKYGTPVISQALLNVPGMIPAGMSPVLDNANLARGIINGVISQPLGHASKQHFRRTTG